MHSWGSWEKGHMCKTVREHEIQVHTLENGTSTTRPTAGKIHGRVYVVIAHTRVLFCLSNVLCLRASI